jgi:hypothetical protein
MGFPERIDRSNPTLVENARNHSALMQPRRRWVLTK